MSLPRPTRRRAPGEPSPLHGRPCADCGGPIDRGSSYVSAATRRCVLCRTAAAMATFAYVPSYRRAVK